MRYTEAQLAEILRKQGHEVTFPVPKARKKPTYEESRIQQALVAWFVGVARDNNIDAEYLLAFPLQGHRSAANGARMKAEGMRAGTPDLFLAVPRNKYHGLWIELKTATGKLSPPQRAMITRLDQQGYAAGAAYGFEDAKKYILAYLAGETFF